MVLLDLQLSVMKIAADGGGKSGFTKRKSAKPIVVIYKIHCLHLCLPHKSDATSQISTHRILLTKETIRNCRGDHLFEMSSCQECIIDSGRCLRLLRPLKISLAKLTKPLKDMAEEVQLEKDTNDEFTPDSPEWLRKDTTIRKRTIRRQQTYASRPKATTSNQVCAPIFDGRIPLPALYISEATQTPEKARTPIRRRRGGFKIFSQDTSSRVIQSYLAILNATVTSEEKADLLEQRPRNAPSLKSIAVRKLASHLKVIDNQDCRGTPSKREDPIESILRTLDELGNTTLQAPILRAFATSLIRDAIRDKSLLAKSIMEEMYMVSPFPRMDSLYEMNWIRQAVLATIRPNPRLKNCLRDDTFQMSLRSVQHLSKSRMGLMNQLFRNRHIPIDWLGAPEFQRHWKDIIIQATSKQDQSPQTTSYVLEIVQLACGIKPMFDERLSTLKHVPISAKPALNCVDCRKDHLNPPHFHQKVDIQSAFTRSISSFFSILTSLVLVGSEEYTEQSERASVWPNKFEPDLNKIRSLIHVSASQLIGMDTHLWNQEASIYAERTVSILFAAFLLFATTPTPVGQCDLEPNEIISQILWIDKKAGSHHGSLAKSMARLLLAINTTATELSQEARFLDYILGCFRSNQALSKGSRRFLKLVEDELKPTTSNNLPPQNTETKRRSIYCGRSYDDKFDNDRRYNIMGDDLIVAKTPARPSWPSNRLIMSAKAVPFYDYDDSDEEDYSFQSQEATFVDSDVVEELPKQIPATPRVIMKVAKKVGLISDLIPSSSPIMKPPDTQTWPLKPRLAQPKAPSLRQSCRIHDETVHTGVKRYFDEDFEEDSTFVDSEESQSPPKKARLAESLENDENSFEHERNSVEVLTQKPRFQNWGTRLQVMVIDDDDELA
jgi:hypothetical protein